MEIYLIRHTRVAVDQDVCYGQYDVELAQGFEQERTQLLRHLAPPDTLSVYSSPLSRCRRLAEWLRPAGDIIYDNRLMEFNFGSWEMKKWSEIDPHLLQTWMDDYVNTTVEGGESYLQMYERVCSCWDDILAAGHQRVALVTHGGVVRAILALLLHIPLNKAFTLDIAYGGISLVKWQPGYPRVMYINR